MKLDINKEVLKQMKKAIIESALKGKEECLLLFGNKNKIQEIKKIEGKHHSVMVRGITNRGDFVGSFHTHPSGLNMPSEADRISAILNKEKIMFIAGNNLEKKVVGYDVRTMKPIALLDLKRNRIIDLDKEIKEIKEKFTCTEPICKPILPVYKIVACLSKDFEKYSNLDVLFECLKR